MFATLNGYANGLYGYGDWLRRSVTQPLSDPVEQQLRRTAEALRHGDADAEEAFNSGLEDWLPGCREVLYTRGMAQQLAELGRLSDAYGPSSQAARVFASAVARCTRPPQAGPELCLQMARDPAVMR